MAIQEYYNGTNWVTAGGGTVKSITAGTGLNGGVITDTGTVSLADTTVVAGTYDLFTVNQQGQITFASNAPPPTDPFINDLPINGDVNLETFNLTTTGNLSATTGSVITNNLASFNATNILVQNDLDLQNNSIINLPTPTIGSNPATKDYVDNSVIDFTGTLNQINVSPSTAIISLSNTIECPGNISVSNGQLTIPVGTTLERPTNPVIGMVRINTDL
jgi:hypothetical protein